MNLNYLGFILLSIKISLVTSHIINSESIYLFFYFRFKLCHMRHRSYPQSEWICKFLFWWHCGWLSTSGFIAIEMVIINLAVYKYIYLFDNDFLIWFCFYNYVVDFTIETVSNDMTWWVELIKIVCLPYSQQWRSIINYRIYTN